MIDFRLVAKDPIPEIRTIVELRDPVLRNAHITHRYHLLSEELRRTVGARDANWSTFATWASKTAGESIRGEEVPVTVRRMFEASTSLLEGLGRLNRALPWAPDVGFEDLLVPVREGMLDLSAAISEGNLKVFAELAPLFTDFSAMAVRHSTYDASELARFTSRLAKGPVDVGGQDLLRNAFEAYYRCRHETEPVRRARLILLANCSIGFHEQTRLQPQIERAMDAPIDAVVRAGVMTAFRAVVPDRFEEPLGEFLLEPLDTLVDGMAAVFRRLATRFLMDLSLPFGRSLAIGEPLPPFSVPEELAQLDDPEGLASLWHRFDAPGDDTAARDWARIPDRMNYIVNLFRSRQRDEDLFAPPFELEPLSGFEPLTC